jgi:uracil-DNA glycosylase family 4
MHFKAPEPQCQRCPRLAAFREANHKAHPAFHNGAVSAFGDLSAKLLIVGLAPGLKGANATGRPFTGDYAGDVLYESLLKTELATGHYAKRADDGLALLGVRITNAVRCVPPENKPIGEEIKQCNGFLTQEIAAMPKLKVILSLGGISHKAVLQALGYKQSHAKFAHAAEHRLRDYILLNSYHCSRYNINTNRLTQAMFDAVMLRAKALLE